MPPPFAGPRGGPRWQTLAAAVKKTKSEFAAYERESIKLQENLKHLKDKDKKQRKALDKVRRRAAQRTRMRRI